MSFFIIISDIVMPDEGVKAELELGEPPQEYLDWALKELGELPDVRIQKLDELRNLIYGKYIKWINK